MQKAKIAEGADAPLGSSSAVTAMLVVDDDPIQRRVIGKIGTQAGHKVLVADSLDAALRIMETERIDCLTLDLGLGDDTGLDLLQMVASMDRKIQVLIISGASEFMLESTKNLAQRKKVKLFDVFTKPLDLARLRGALAKAREACLVQKQAEA